MQRHGGFTSFWVRPLYTPRGPPLLACHEFANSINSGLNISVPAATSEAAFIAQIRAA
jgi:hypothetical protein